MRAYFFTNFYLSSIQKGIQSAHCIAEISMLYPNPRSPQGIAYSEWARKHKTMIVLNGGNHETLQCMTNELLILDQERDSNIAWGTFCEDGVSLNGATTCVGAILPERVYTTSALIREIRCPIDVIDDLSFQEDQGLDDISDIEIYFIKAITTCPLAN